MTSHKQDLFSEEIRHALAGRRSLTRNNSRRHRLATILCWVLIIIGVALLAGYIATHPAPAQPPCAQHQLHATTAGSSLSTETA
jgi:hypothetical protein